MGDCVSRVIFVTLSVSQDSHLGHSASFGLKIAQIFEYERLLFYVDDMKMFLLVHGFQDCF
jgi:hypothetical protein